MSDGAEPSPECPESRSLEALKHESFAPSWDPTRDIATQFTSSVADGLLWNKYMQHQRFQDLWWQYVAWESARDKDLSACASWSTFHRCWDSQWRNIVGVRKKCQHAECTECSEYSKFLHVGRATPEDKSLGAQRWREHLADQYLDRSIYRQLRHWARRRGGNILSIIIDSMDKTKCAWPRYDFRQNKWLDKFVRPRIVVACAIAHGYVTAFYLADDEAMFHGASTFCEILTRVIALVARVCESRGCKFPEHLVVQSDNTTSQAKNGQVSVFLATLVRKFKFKTCTLNF